MSGTLSYDPHSRVFHEKFFQSANFESMGDCPADPWTTGAVCTNQKVRVVAGASNDKADPNQFDLRNAPFSISLADSVALFQPALANASRPGPPGPPVNVAAQATVLWRDIHVRWLAPDESGNRPYLQFRVQVRPQGATGAAWDTLADVPRASGTSYDLGFKLPAMPAGYTGWTVRACSLTALAETCSAEIAPEVTSNALARQDGQLYHAVQPAPVPGPGVRATVSPPMPNAAYRPAPVQASPTQTVAPVPAPNPGVKTAPAVPPGPTTAPPNPVLTRPATTLKPTPVLPVSHPPSALPGG
jgi:hypothetical protein